MREKIMCVLWKDLHGIILEPFATEGRAKLGMAAPAGAAAEGDAASRLTASLLILERLFHILHIPGLLNAFFASMFLPRAKALQMVPLIWSADLQEESPSPAAPVAPASAANAAKGGWYDAWPVFRECIAEGQALHSESTLCVRFLHKCIKSKCLDEDLMDSAGLLPSKKKTSRMLFNELTSFDSSGSGAAAMAGQAGAEEPPSGDPSGENPAGGAPELTSAAAGALGSPGRSTPSKKSHRRNQSTEELANLKLFPSEEAPPSPIGRGAESRPMAADASGKVAAGVDLARLCLEDEGPSPSKIGKDEKGDPAYLMFADLVRIEPFKVDLVNLAGWLLYQLLPPDREGSGSGHGDGGGGHDDGGGGRSRGASLNGGAEGGGTDGGDDRGAERGAVFSPRKKPSCKRAIPEALAQVLDRQMQECASLLSIHLQHSWCDGIPLLVSKAWQRNKRHLISPQVSMNSVETAKFLLQDPSGERKSAARAHQKGDLGMSTAVVAAQQANDAVNAFVAMAQLKVWLETGDLPGDPSSLFGVDRGMVSLDEPVGLIPHDRRPLPVSDGSEVDLSSLHVFQKFSKDSKDGQEGSEAEGFFTGALRCRVAFSQGAGKPKLPLSTLDSGRESQRSLKLFSFSTEQSKEAAQPNDWG